MWLFLFDQIYLIMLLLQLRLKRIDQIELPIGYQTNIGHSDEIPQRTRHNYLHVFNFNPYKSANDFVRLTVTLNQNKMILIAETTRSDLQR